MRNAAKLVQGASLYVFGRITEAEQNMVQKAKALAKATARAVRPMLWRSEFNLRRFLRRT